MPVNPTDKLQRYAQMFHWVTVGQPATIIDAYRGWQLLYSMRLGLKKMSYAWFRNRTVEALKAGFIVKAVDIPGVRIQYKVAPGILE